MTDRRDNPRLDISVEAELRRQGDVAWEPAHLVDVSATGASVITVAPLPPGSWFSDLKFTLPADRGNDALEVCVAAEAVRSEPAKDVRPKPMHRTGLQFVDIDPTLSRSIQKYVLRSIVLAAPKTPARKAFERQRVPLERPISVRYDTLPSFIDEMSTNLSVSGMFIQTAQPRPPRSEFDFEMQIGEEFVVFSGRATVVWVRPHRLGPDQPRGMGVRFVRLDADGKQVVERLVGEHLASGAEAFELYRGLEEKADPDLEDESLLVQELRERIDELEHLLEKSEKENVTLRARLGKIERALLESRHPVGSSDGPND